MPDTEVKFTFNFDKFVTTGVLSMGTMVGIRCVVAFAFLLFASRTDGINFYGFVGLLMLAFSLLIPDAIIAAIISFVSIAKGWSRMTAIYISIPIGILTTFMFGGG